VLFMIHAGDSDVPGWSNAHIFQAIAPGKFGSLLFAVTYMLICWSVGKILEARKIYIKV
jgi:predicted acyltransferase